MITYSGNLHVLYNSVFYLSVEETQSGVGNFVFIVLSSNWISKYKIKEKSNYDLNLLFFSGLPQ